METEKQTRVRARCKASKRYIADNQHALSLPKHKIDCTKATSFNPESVSWVFFNKIMAIFGLGLFFRELARWGKWLLPTLLSKDFGIGRNVIVIGNGPSQGYLTVKALKEFLNCGGDIYVVNFWHENEYLSAITPTHIVLSDPDTLNFDDSCVWREKNIKLKEYLNNNKSIKILCPLSMCSRIAELFSMDRVAGFVDTELRGWSKNVMPIFPRGYLSMTLYKALALAVWAGYENIFVIGMDNTYPRTIYSDSKNSILNLEIHAGTAEFISDQTECYRNIGDLMVDLSRLFYDARLFSRFGNITNLDPYSLTDAFKKVDSVDTESELQVFRKKDNVFF